MKKCISLLLVIVMLLAYIPAGAFAADTGNYYVAGTAELCGGAWECDNAANQMALNADGLYEKTFENVPAGEHQFKVTDGTWDNTWGKDGQNYTFEVSESCDVTITFDAGSKAVNASGDGVGEVTGLEIKSITAVGAGKGNFLNGKSWDVAAAVNHMTASGKVYTITYADVAAGTYEVKFAANDSWNDNWGSNGSSYTSGSAEAVYNGQNIKFTVKEPADITLILDLTNFKYATKNGVAKMFIVNQMDREHADFAKVEAQLREKFGSSVVPILLPIGNGADFKGVVNVLENKAYERTNKGEPKEIPVPADMSDAIEAALEEITEAAASADEELMMKYLDSFLL